MRRFIFVIFVLGMFAAMNTVAKAEGATSSPSIATSTEELPRHIITSTTSVHVFITGQETRRAGKSATSTRMLDVHWYVPWGPGRRIAVLESRDEEVVATSTINSTSSNMMHMSGMLSVPAPVYGEYEYAVHLCSGFTATSTCDTSSPLRLIVTEKGVKNLAETDPSLLTRAEAVYVDNYKRREQLEWIRALIGVSLVATTSCVDFVGCVGTSTYARVAARIPAHLSPDKLFWRRDSETKGKCLLDVVGTSFSLLDPFAKAACAGVGTSTYERVSDEEILLSFSTAKRRETRTASANSYIEGTPSSTQPLLVATYDDARARSNESQPSKLPISRLHVIEYGSTEARDDGLITFVDSYIAHEEFFGGQCLSVGCPHGMLAEFERMKKANPALRVLLRVPVTRAVLSSSTLVRAFEKSTKDFLEANKVFDGFDVIIRSEVKQSELTRLMLPLRDLRVRDAKPYFAITISCTKNECYDHASEVEPYVDMIYVAQVEPPLSKVRYVSSLSEISRGVDMLKLRKVPLSKTGIDVPLVAVLWSDDGAHALDLRKVRSGYLKRGDFTRVLDEKAGASTLVSSSTGIISYEDEEMVSNKALYVLRSGVGAIRLTDILSDDGTLVAKVSRILGDAEKGNACAIAMIPPRNLGSNSRGKDVRALQEFLQCKNFIPGYVELNGSYGKLTEAAVKLFQMSEGLPPVGSVGSSTRNILKRYSLSS